MKLILLWVIVTSSGAVSSGSAEFDDNTSCLAGEAAIAQLATEASGPDRPVSVKTECVIKRYGQPR